MASMSNKKRIKTTFLYADFDRGICPCTLIIRCLRSGESYENYQTFLDRLKKNGDIEVMLLDNLCLIQI